MAPSFGWGSFSIWRSECFNPASRRRSHHLLPIDTNTPPGVSKERIYLAPLDGLRFVAFMLVLISHVNPPQSFTFLYALNRHGWAGVDLFFVVSSFLFFTLFQVEYQRTGRIAVLDFFARRMLRIYPLMVGAPLLFMFLLQGRYEVSDAWREFLAIATFGDNILSLPWFRRAIPAAGHLWTLSFEFQIYLVMPAFFYVCVRLGQRRAIFFLLVVWLACVGLRAHYALGHAQFPSIYFNPILRPDSVLLGMALALIAKQVTGHVWTAAALLLLSTIAFFNLPHLSVNGPSNIPLYAVTAIFSGAMLWLTLKWHWLSLALSSRWLVYLGKRSFGLYVFHVIGNVFAREVIMPALGVEPTSEGLYWSVAFVLTAALAILMAIVSYRFFERPFLILKDMRAAVLSRPI